MHAQPHSFTEQPQCCSCAFLCQLMRISSWQMVSCFFAAQSGKKVWDAAFYGSGLFYLCVEC